MYYFKGGGFVPGVPARDLTDVEAKSFEVEDSPLYSQDETDALTWQAEPVTATTSVEAVGAAVELEAVSEDEADIQELENEISEGVDDNGNGD